MMRGRSRWNYGLMHMATSHFGGQAAFICRKTNSASSYTARFGGCSMVYPNNRTGRAAFVLSAVVLTASAYFLSSGLHRMWWLAWLAPPPTLVPVPKLRCGGALGALY